MTGLGTPYSWAFGISNNGQVVGEANIGSGNIHAFLYNNGVMTDLGTLGGSNSYADGINNSGQVVGEAYTPSGSPHAFVYSNGIMTDLNSLITTSGWTLEEATGINDNGQICGDGYTAGRLDAFLLTPVPEPSSFILLGIGAISLLGFASAATRAGTLLVVCGGSRGNAPRQFGTEPTCSTWVARTTQRRERGRARQAWSSSPWAIRATRRIRR